MKARSFRGPTDAGRLAGRGPDRNFGQSPRQCAGRRAHVVVLVGCVLALIGTAGCGRNEVAHARARAVDFFAREVDRADPSWASLFGYMHRRFGIEVVDARGRALHTASAGDRDGGWIDIYRRLDDPGANVPTERIAAIPSQTDRMTALALHCDRIGVPAQWPDVLRAASDTGGYALTHAALSTRWTIENGCLPPERLAPLEALQRERLAGMTASRDDLEREYRSGTDLWLESIAMLFYLGGAAHLDPSTIDAVLARQRGDGGWPAHPNAASSDPHATALALWVLLEHERPGTPPIRWIAEP